MINVTPRRVALLAIYVGLLLLELFLSVRYSTSGLWLSFFPSPDGPWCERGENYPLAFNKEPFNSRSDFLFLAVGLIVIEIGLTDRDYLAREAKRDTEERKQSDKKNEDGSATPTNPAMRRNLKKDGQAIIDGYPPQEKQAYTPPVTFPRRLLPKSNLVLSFPSISVSFGALQAAHAFGTYLNHASRTFLGWQLDVIGMYCVISWTLTYFCLQEASEHLALRMSAKSAARSTSLIPSYLASVEKLVCLFNASQFLVLMPMWYLTTIVDLGLGLDELLVSTIIVIILIALSLVGLRRRYVVRVDHSVPFHEHYVILAAVLFLVAFICWNIDLHLCPYVPYYFQGHALWHILSSGSLLCLYFFVRTSGCYSLRETFAALRE